MRFLEYDKETFIPWLRSYAGRRTILDVGCGEGHLIQDLLDDGASKVFGLDFRALAPRALEPWIVIDDATTSPILQVTGALLVLARPCHGDWIRTVVDRAKSEVLYLGRGSKLPQDLAEISSKMTQIDAPGVHPCVDGEPVGVWSHKGRHLSGRGMTYWLVDEAPQGACWKTRSTAPGPKGRPWTPEAEDLGWWTNNDGAGYPVGPSDVILEGPVTVYDERQLDWTRCRWVQEMIEKGRSEDEISGWITPDGAFHCVTWMNHDKYAYYVLGHEVRDLEAMGWARLHGPRSRSQTARLAGFGFGFSEGDGLFGTDDETPFASRRDDQMLTERQVATVRRLLTKFGYPIED